MNKINGLVLSALTAAFLVGCGGGSGGGSGGGTTTSTDTGTTATDVTVERGPLLDAVITDANGNLATAKSANSNVYTFATTPAYPITATGGYIDVDANGIIDTNDVAFTGVLKSYSTVVTPITTYIATATTADERAAKLAELKAKIGGTVSDDDLLKKVPSSTTADIIVLSNAIYDSYSVLFDTDSSNDDVSGLSTTFDNAKSKYAQTVSTNTGKTVKELGTLVEQELITTKSISKLNDDEVYRIDHIWKLSKNSVSGKTFRLTSTNDGINIVFKINPDGTSSETSYHPDGSVEYTETSTWTILPGITYNKLQITLDKNKSVSTIAFIETPANGLKATVLGGIKLAYVGTISDFGNITSSSSNDSSSSSFTLTHDMFSGKKLYLENNGDNENISLKSDGTVYYTWSFANGDSGSCDGTWSVSGNKLYPTLTNCTDGENSNSIVAYSVIFNEAPQNGVNVTFVYGNEKEDGVITTISDIDSSTPTTPTNLVWESWPTQNPMMDGEPIITLDMLIASFTNTSYSNWFDAMDNNGNDIEATLSSNGNVVNVSGHEQYGGALHGSTVLGSWDRSNNMINITMNTGEKIHIRLGTSGVNYVVQVSYE